MKVYELMAMLGESHANSEVYLDVHRELPDVYAVTFVKKDNKGDTIIHSVTNEESK